MTFKISFRTLGVTSCAANGSLPVLGAQSSPVSALVLSFSGCCVSSRETDVLGSSRILSHTPGSKVGSSSGLLARKGRAEGERRQMLRMRTPRAVGQLVRQGRLEVPGGKKGKEERRRAGRRARARQMPSARPARVAVPAGNRVGRDFRILALAKAPHLRKDPFRSTQHRSALARPVEASSPVPGAINFRRTCGC